MHDHRVTEIQDPGPLKCAKKVQAIAIVLIVLGLYSFGHQMRYTPKLAWASYLEGFFFALCLSMGGMFFLAVNHLAKSNWSLPVRRVAEAATSYLPFALLTLVPILVFYEELYVWHDPVAAGITGTKAIYLSFKFWALRICGYLIVWNLFAAHFRAISARQDQSKEKLTTTLVSAIYLIVYGFTFCLFAFDVMMSLRPHWFSTMYGVYCFAGSYQSGLCAIILMTLFLIKKGYFHSGLFKRERHLFDLGTWLLAFSTFMCYIGFSQFMLIWYANLPEEITFFIDRFQGHWKCVYIIIFIIKWVMPFTILMPKPSRRSSVVLAIMCCLIMFAEWLDIFWLVSPEFVNGGGLPLGHLFYSLLTGLGFLGLFVLVFTNYLKKHSVVAVGEPKLLGSINGDYV